MGAAYTMSVLASLTFLCFLSTFFNEFQVHADINTVKVVVKNVPDYAAGKEKNDLGFLTFDLQADLTPLFNWNVKQLFLYLTAEYETPNNKLNQVVLWDKIILRGENALWDYGNGLLNHQNVTMTLSWNIIPNAGNLPRIMSSGKHSFSFPDSYTTSRVM